jgi:hypothetical protein
MATRGRGPKQNNTKNYRSHDEWMVAKKIGRKKQRWVPVQFVEHTGQPFGGYWEKVS